MSKITVKRLIRDKPKGVMTQGELSIFVQALVTMLKEKQITQAQFNSYIALLKAAYEPELGVLPN